MSHVAELFAAGLGIGVAGLVLFFLLAFIAVPLVIGVLVYKDAQKQGMSSPLLWTLVAALAPSFIGLIIYLVVRCTNEKGA